MTWKFVDIFFSTYQRNIAIESTSVRLGVSVGYYILLYHLLLAVTFLFNDHPATHFPSNFLFLYLLLLPSLLRLLLVSTFNIDIKARNAFSQQ